MGGKAYSRYGGGLEFFQTMEQNSDHILEIPGIDIHQDLSMLLYTFGTTDVPKRAMINHYQVERGAYANYMGVNGGGHDVFIVFLPCTHAYGKRDCFN